MFRDGLGERRLIVNPSGTDRIEVLCLRGELTSVPSFEFALRERVSHLAQFRHAFYARVRSVERLSDAASTLALVSDATDGDRLSSILEASDRHGFPLDINAALCLIRQIVPAIATLHQAASPVSHGAVAPERIIVTPHARVVVSEYVLGAALEQLRYSQERYWQDLRVPTARVGGVPRFDQRTDVTAVGVIALSLIIGRPLGNDEFPGRLPEVLGSAWAISARGGLEPLPAGLRAWLARMLQLDARASFNTMADAQAELERVLGESDYLAAPSALEAVLAQYREAIGVPEAAAAASVPAVLPTAVNDARIAPPIAAQPAAAPAVASTSPLTTTAAATPSTVVAASATGFSSAPPTATPSTTPATPPSTLFGSAPAVTVLGDAVAMPRTMPAAASAPKPQPKPAPPEPVVVVSPKEPDPIVEEPDEIEEEAPAAGRNWTMLGGALVLVAAVAGGGAFAARKYMAHGATPTTGTVVVTTNPAGAQLIVDGVLRGSTPATLSVAPGAHTLVVRVEGGEPRTIPIAVTAGGQISQYLDLPKAAPTAGQLQVRTEPAGVQVSIDGIARGVSPVTIDNLTPGAHTVAVEGELGKVEQTVNVDAGSTASVLVPLTAPKGAPVSGWISVSAPAEVQLYEGGKLLGSSKMDRLMVSAGSHQIDLVNESLGYRTTKTVQVGPGKVAAIKADFPKGTIALNAVPWADVWIDGEKVGETPLGNLQVPIGQHDVVFRNPDLGEQHHTIVVSLTSPARLSVDMRKK